MVIKKIKKSLNRATAFCVFTTITMGCSEQPAVPSTAGQNTSSIEELCATGPQRGELALHVPSPDWQDQVIYMLMIDRFNDGDPDNNDFGAGEYNRYQGNYFNGGDFAGLIDKLDYLKDLGATALWITPPVANQWWSREYQAAGWHGYWATHFMEVDQHFGTIEDYKRLSHELHCKDMYLIQDMVVNHVGNFYNYDGDYDPKDTAKNFFLLEEGHPTQEAPAQYPFNMINRLNPEHAKADIYHWTPPISDYADRHQELYYGLGTISDINTENPLVIDTFKKTYNYWIEEVGIDGFRMDTVMMVPVQFFQKFLHDDDGIYSRAKSLGKDHFLTFGEVVASNPPFEVSGEEKVIGYLGTEAEPALNSMLGYPLYFELKQVLSEGRPTHELAFRLDTFMKAYPDPYVIPNFVDNHDTQRFLNGGSKAAFKQALAVLMTIPGIPIILQGTEQGLKETRQTMFGPAYGSREDNFKPESEYFRYLKSLTSLRKENKVFTRGTMTQIASTSVGKGIFAYQREYQGESVLVLLNSAEHSILVKDLDAGFAGDTQLKTLFSEKFDESVVTAGDGTVSLKLPGRALVVVSDKGSQFVRAEADNKQENFSVTVDSVLTNDSYSSDIPLYGSVSVPGSKLKLVINGNLDDAKEFSADAKGHWKTSIPVRNFGESSNHFQIYAPEYRYLTAIQSYVAKISEPTYTKQLKDGTADAKGPNGRYTPPQHKDARHQLEIETVSLRGGGANLELNLVMKNLTDIWLPPNGFDNVAFSIFVDIPAKQGASKLPLINAEMPAGGNWDLGHFVTGWNNFIFSSDGATIDHRGDIVSGAPDVGVDKELRRISIRYSGEKIGVKDWAGVKFYITTWDVNGEATYAPILPEPSSWGFSGAETNAAKIMDEVLITVPTRGG
ncbi:alpha-amylase [Pseudomaricurvus alkylphenolicus]|uniref:alpha-amylase family glycosyl hydrolase n=1 Tax=Pseudomaricurvus alkylphenolicus TaxID=1306991 RepID=UPI00141EEBEE|nr:alpha-amylase [Pseudomaricurvus alkylphenolicus]